MNAISQDEAKISGEKFFALDELEELFPGLDLW